MERTEARAEAVGRVGAAAAAYESVVPPAPLTRIPVRSRDELTFVAVADIASIVAERELLHLHTTNQTRHTITYRLKDLEARLDSTRFIRLGRGTLANLDALDKVSVMPGGTHVAQLSNGQKLHISRIQSRHLRARLFKL